jgi:hypothetical protein
VFVVNWACEKATLSLRGRQWYGYFRQAVLDPETDTQRVRKIGIKLGLKSQMTKFEARDALRTEITKRTGQNLGGRVLKNCSVTFEWFVRTRLSSLTRMAVFCMSTTTSIGC